MRGAGVMWLERRVLSAWWHAGIALALRSGIDFPSGPVRRRLLMACVPLLGLLVTACQREPESVAPERRQVLAALMSAERALAHAEARSDVIFNFAQGGKVTGRRFEPQLVREIAQHEGRHPLLALEHELWVMRHRDLPTLQPTAMEIDPSFDARTSEAPQEQIIARVLNIMATALSCSGKIELHDLVGDPGVGYVSTHQLLALQIATERGCISSSDLRNGANPYVRRVYSEMMLGLDEFSDVQVERAAFLALAGRLDVVPPSFLRELILRQSDDGLWRLGMPPDHTTSLAYLLLSIVYGQRDEARPPAIDN